jgi:hypothetical protein
MDPRDEMEEEDLTGCLTAIIPSVVTGCCAFVRADAENPSECVCALHSATAFVVLLASLHAFRVLVSTNSRWRPQGSLSFPGTAGPWPLAVAVQHVKYMYEVPEPWAEARMQPNLQSMTLPDAAYTEPIHTCNSMHRML